MTAPASKLEIIRKLLARHGVDAAVLAASGKAPEDVLGDQRIEVTNPHAREKATLAS